MKFDAQSRSSSLIVNMIFQIVDLDPKLNTWQIWFQNCNVTDFYEVWHSEHIEHASYEYINRN